jgi:hypothetical protein
LAVGSWQGVIAEEKGRGGELRNPAYIVKNELRTIE